MIRRLLKDLKVEKDHLLWGILSLRYLVVVLVILLIFILIGALLTRFTTDYENVKDAFSLNNSILDTANGILTPLIAATAVATTFLAFLVQYQANQNQRNDIKRERAETKFYELLKLHKENVNEISIGEFKGREAFIKMYDEFQFAYFAVLEVYEDEEKTLQNKKLNLEDLISVDAKFRPMSPEEIFAICAYHICFFGVNNLLNSRDSLFPKNIQRWFFSNSLKKMKSYQDEYVPPKKMNLKLKSFHKENRNVRLLSQPVRPFDGNVGKLGHYYRHLYQLVKYVVVDEDLILSRQTSAQPWLQRYSYIKIIRAQLSNHEQTLIYYNSFFSAGRVWFEDKSIDKTNEEGQPISYFLDYAIIKNLPYNLVRGIGPWPVLLFRQLLDERGYAKTLDGNQKMIAIQEKLNWLFEWEGG